ncbi:PE-PGRS family protein [Streptomyces albus]|uniref:PE-PGRS family protein n=1 Tax=Streptomyces albus (strain ATCC 21838 / DSM 41398 / FERM P-419 / JCM 4703 / NBRC 107858) TaxID=1081613 RepID=A0A0B5EW53_STRA4|nr:PE-PGRS family protein [Streptomyces albus]AOU81357.1 PE-PGRS family protein [Streptomyces albus]AYN37051.1 PE-PGRS family protein [Streptomyces albus]
MPQLRREPDWDQGVDRHSELVDPVLTVRQLSRFDHRKGYSRIDNALVFTTDKGEYDVYLPPRRPTRSLFATRRYTAVYEVDMGVHASAVSLLLASDNDAFDFTAQVELTWQVSRPQQFVASGERDVPALLRRRIEQLARPISRRFPIDLSADAERAVCEALSRADVLGAEAGLRTSCTARLRLDEAAVIHQRELRRIRYSDEQLSRSHDLAMREERLRAERSLEQARHDHELVVLRGRQDEEARELEAEKVRYYEHHLQYGGVAMWAMHLARHPEDSRLVMENLQKDQLELIKSQSDVALQVLKEGNPEDYQRAGLNRQAVEILEGLLARNLPGMAASLPVVSGPRSESTGLSVHFHNQSDGTSGNSLQEKQ